MRLFVYGCRPYDEEAIFQSLAEQYQIALGTTTEQPSVDNAALARGYDAVSVVAVPVTADILTTLHQNGVSLVSTRTIGYDHIDLAAAKALGITICNAGYDPDAVADYTVMLMLMALRNEKRILQRANLHDFSMPGLIGRQMRSCTVGIVGAGKIGARVMDSLRGFGCKVLYWNRSKKSGLPGTQVPLDVLLRESNIISLHIPFTEETHHLINREVLASIKPGTILVNTARGGLVDTEALIDALESGHLGGAALDVVEGEAGLYHFNKMSDQIGSRFLSILKDMPNVIVTPHMAFYTREAVAQMAQCSIDACLCLESGTESPWRIC